MFNHPNKQARVAISRWKLSTADAKISNGIGDGWNRMQYPPVGVLMFKANAMASKSLESPEQLKRNLHVGETDASRR